MLWTVLYHVNPTTITVALALSFAAALAFACLRPPMRVIVALMTTVYLVILVAPISSITAIGEGDRWVVWDPMLSFQDIGGEPYPSPVAVMVNDEVAVHYSSKELPVEERHRWDEPGVEWLFSHGKPDGGLVLTDSEGEVVESPQAVAVIEEELEMQEAYASRVEEEGPWGHSGGLALQERTLNTLLFVPVGIVAFFAFGSWTARLLFGPMLSLTIEASQWALAAGRTADTGDLLVNGVGSLVGTLMALSAVALVGLRKPATFEEAWPEQPAEEPEPDRSR